MLSKELDHTLLLFYRQLTVPETPFPGALILGKRTDGHFRIVRFLPQPELQRLWLRAQLRNHIGNSARLLLACGTPPTQWELSRVRVRKSRYFADAEQKQRRHDNLVRRMYDERTDYCALYYYCSWDGERQSTRMKSSTYYGRRTNLQRRWKASAWGPDSGHSGPMMLELLPLNPSWLDAKWYSIIQQA